MKQIKSGKVISTYGSTVKAEVVSELIHPKYLKRYHVSKNFLIDNPNKLEIKVGDIINFESCKPISKKKYWRIVA